MGWMVSREGTNAGGLEKGNPLLYKLLGTLLERVLSPDVQAVVLLISYDSSFYSGIAIYLWNLSP